MWYFSEAEHRLTCSDQSVELTPKASEILACLIRHDGAVVPVETFLEEVWPNIHVSSDLVREYVSDLRAALGDDARNPHYIETVRGRGFRLKGGVKVSGSEETALSERRESEIRPTVAVLKPTVTGGQEIEIFAESLASDIINHLARFHYVGVVARHSTFSATEVSDLRAFARDVDANYLLETNVAALNNRVRVRFQLVDAETGRNLWAERFDHDTEDLFAKSDDVTNAVVLALTGWHGELHRAEFKTVARRRDADLNAFEHFVLGCDLEMRLDADSLGRSLYHLEQSVKLDPTFARAWLVYALELRWAYAVIPGRDKSFLERSRRAFETSFKLAPSDPVTLGLMSMQLAREGNVDGALSMLARAEATMAGDSDAMVCVSTAKSVLTDDIEGACAIFKTAVEANKTPPSWFYFAEAGLAFLAGEFERCIASSRSGPQEISAIIFRCLSYAMLGDADMARASHDDLRLAFPNVDFARFADKFPIVSRARRDEYDEALRRLTAILDEEKWPRLAT